MQSSAESGLFFYAVGSGSFSPMIGRRRLQRYQQRKNLSSFMSPSQQEIAAKPTAHNRAFLQSRVHATRCSARRCAVFSKVETFNLTPENKSGLRGCLFAGATPVRLYCLRVSVRWKIRRRRAAWRRDGSHAVGSGSRQRLTKSSLAATLGSALRAPSRLCTTEAFTFSLEGWR